MRTKIEIRECAWVNGKAFKWQGHVYVEGHPYAEPLISGLPQNSANKAKSSLWKTIAEYKELINGAESLKRRHDNLKQAKAEDANLNDFAETKQMVAEAMKNETKTKAKTKKEK